MENEFEKIFAASYPGFLSIRNHHHEIIYLNDNFRNWVAEYTDVDPIGKTNVELAKLVPKNVADTFLQCHDGSLDLQKKDGSSGGLSKIIEFKSADDNPLLSQYFDVLKYKIKYKEEDHIFTIAYDITELYVENQYNLLISVVDPLTQAKNRRYFEQNIDLLYGHNCVLFDLDNFKMVNDNEGHDVGDKILQEFVATIKQIKDVIAMIRIGGDEFIAIFRTSVEEHDICKMINQLRKEYNKRYKQYSYLSFSYGVGMVEKGLVETIQKIDKALYADKENKH
ncbi:MAG: GGDEF domain-containing protein [Coprobacillus sp.]